MEDLRYDDAVQRIVSAPEHSGLSQLICLAVCNNEFAEQLLSNPADVLEQLPEGVTLTNRDRQMLLELPWPVSDIAELATRLWRRITEQVQRVAAPPLSAGDTALAFEFLDV